MSLTNLSEMFSYAGEISFNDAIDTMIELSEKYNINQVPHMEKDLKSLCGLFRRMNDDVRISTSRRLLNRVKASAFRRWPGTFGLISLVLLCVTV